MTSGQPAPEAAGWRGVSVRYPYAEKAAVGPVDLAVRQGERVLLLGASGSGKSTLLSTLTGLIPQSLPATVDGDIRLFGERVADRKPAEWAATVAQYFQDAERTLCGMRVEDEIAFALENRAWPEARIREKVAEAMRRTGIPDEWRGRRTATLSGGEKQLVALAATLAQEAPLFVADEPTAHLAPEAARRMQRLLTEGGDGRTVLIVDHRLDGLIQSIDRVAVLGDDGRILAEGPPRTLFREGGDLLQPLGIWQPLAALLDAELQKAGIVLDPPPLSVEEALEGVDQEIAFNHETCPPLRLAPSGLDTSPPLREGRGQTGRKLGARPLPHIVGERCRGEAETERGNAQEKQPSWRREAAIRAVAAFLAAHSAAPAETAAGKVVARLVDADCAPFLGPTVLRGTTVAIAEGEILGILGPNGAGKSTLGASLAGLLRLKAGRREGAPGGIAFQNPESQFAEGSVEDEIRSALPQGMADGEKALRIAAILAEWRLGGLERLHPFELSQGQKRRLALATLSASGRWPLLVLDEPLAGLDRRGATELARHIEDLARSGRAVAVVTHDMDFALRLCPRAVVLGEGRILADGATADLLGDRGLLRRAGLAEPALAPARRWLARHGAC